MAVLSNRPSLRLVAPLPPWRDTNSGLKAGYAALLNGGSPNFPVRAAMVLPDVRCPTGGAAGRTAWGFTVGITLVGATTGIDQPVVVVLADCTAGHVSFTSDPSFGPGKAMRPGDHLTISVSPALHRSVETLVDTTRHYRTVQASVGIIADEVDFTLTPTLDLAGGIPTAGGIGPFKYEFSRVPAFAPISFQACSIGGRALSAYNLDWDELPASLGHATVTASALLKDRFTLTRRGGGA